MRGCFIPLTFLLISSFVILTEASRHERKSLFRKGVLQKNQTEDRNHRRGKLFSLFNVVTFGNEPCTSSSTTNGVNRNGTCYTATECNDRGGSANGNCAAGFGVCCLFIFDGTGSTTISENCSYIQNEGFPTAITTTSTQSYTIQRVSDDVCYLRLDFETFTLLGTNGSTQTNEGACTDTFTVATSTGMQVPTICGENTGQHIYVDIGANSGDTATLTFTTTATATNRMWDIKVTQVECENESAPRDSCCLQYHTGCTGRLTSFNFPNTNDNHLNNQQYQICIRQECGFCCVEYSVCPDQLTLIGGTGPPVGFSFDVRMTVTSSKNDGVCRSSLNSIDYIGIQNSGATCAPAGGACDRAVNSRYCGRFLNQNSGVTTNSPICDCTGPFTVDVFFDSQSDVSLGGTPTIQSRGFCLEYRQVPCK